MNSTCRTAIAAAVAGGYVLGRTRKAKMAFAIGTLLAGRRFGLNPASLAAEGVRQLRETPHLAGLREQIGGDLVEAARAAASASADRRFSAFADTLRERGREDTGGEDLEDEDYEDEPEEPDESEEPDEPDEPDEPEEESSERRQAPARERKKAPAKKAAAKKTGPAKKAAARGKAAPAKKAAAKKTAPSRSRSTTSRRGR
ncbi:hypothetical protein NMG29_28485 [Streptomyces cocklensis]|uniref:Histone protein n=1 Tax=Actinacidiphila cocklensis TaxID=887465 RepID=A0A9W4DUP0_9ACTN|nr:hypothetical protein [Actinacidiphila cocklensis]MDD1062113.1 hypothetical protein [Actinacidiphila cocklensis]CAG6396360.1 conserved hypothetical protein [Actinacidiphila cocklensis]